MTIAYDEKENRCYQCLHYSSRLDLCHLKNLFGYCDFKPNNEDIESEEIMDENRGNYFKTGNKADA